MAEQVVVFEIAVPAIYTADLDDYREYRGEHESESDWLLNCIGDPSMSCRLRVQTSGEKEGTVQEVWGYVHGARLADASELPPNVDEDFLARNGIPLVRDEDACEWCDSEVALLSSGASVEKGDE